MADVIVEAVVGPIIENLISLLGREVNLIKGVEKDVENLSATLITIQAVLEDAERRQIKDKSITVWLTDLKHAAYDAEDVLEEWTLEVAKKRDEEFTDTGCTRTVSRSISSYMNCNIIYRHKMAKKLKELISTFNEIAERKNKFHLNAAVVPHTEPQIDKKRESTSKITEPQIYGRDGDKKNVIDILLSNVDSPAEVSICSIVGFGGVGKTTLAQSVYNDERVVRCFEVRIWVCVSEPFDLKRVLKAIIEAFEKKHCDLEPLEPIQSKVGDILRDKRYLLVLDDVWNENQDEWNKLKGFFSGGAKGSSIIITTRLERVASLTGSLPIYRLGVLSDDDCWHLLKNRAFGGSGLEGHPNLVKVGMEIAKKCKGLPLAAKFLGSLLGSKIDKKHWEFVRDSEIWKSEEGGENTILPALRLSYNHLPSHLKQCFTYCSIYPKDHEMEKDKLIRSWIANGFIKSQGKMEMEEIGDDTFSELLRLSFFQDAMKDEYGNIKTCKMHDLMHDLACFISVNECLIINAATKVVPKKIRHLSVFHHTDFSTVTPLPSLRTLLLIEAFPSPRFKLPTSLRVLQLSNWYIGSLRHLKHLIRYLGISHKSLCVFPKVVLKLSNLHIGSLLHSIRHLKHLRYLDISHNSLSVFPKVVLKLSNLQMLDLSDNKLNSLPEFIFKLRNLQVLDLSRNSHLRILPQSIGKLEALRCLNLSRTGITTLPTSIVNLESLRYLNLYRTRITTLPTSIVKWRSLRSLNLCKTCISSLPDSFQSLKYLLSLDLSDNDDLVALPNSICDLTNLQSLILINCRQLQALPENMRNMSSLIHLDIQYCYKLSKMPVGIGKLKCLQTLSRFVVGVHETDNRCAGIEELQELNLLSGELAIEGLENVRNSENAKQANLKSKQYLDKLELIWHADTTRPECNSKEVLEGLELPRNLRVLSIYGYRWDTCFPQGFLQNYNALKSLEIKLCYKLKSLPAGMRNLTALTSLKIIFCKELLLTNEDFQNLTSLLSLVLEGLGELRALPEGMKHITMLQHLEISHCQSLRILPEWLKQLPALQYLKIWLCNSDLHRRCEKDKGEDWHIISHIPTVSIWSYPNN